jgi:hypothetical protein
MTSCRRAAGRERPGGKIEIRETEERSLGMQAPAEIAAKDNGG